MVQGHNRAVIIASGFGKGLEKSIPLPLIPLFGVPIIEHIIRRLRELGLDIYILYDEEALKNVVSTKFPHVSFIRDSEPESNLVKKICVAYRKIGGGFFLLMGDHYYGEEFFREMKKVVADTTIFISDKNPRKSGATEIQKDNRRYFYADMAFFSKDTLANMCKDEKNLLSDPVEWLLHNDNPQFIVVKDFWIEIKGVEDLRFAERVIERKIVKNEDGYISRLINRRISLKISKFLARFDAITPNVMTIVSFLVGTLAAYLFFIRALLIGALITELAAILDGCDGEIARIKRIATKYGAALDAVSDRYVDALITLGIFSNLPINIISITAFFLSVTGVILFSYTWHMTKIRIKIGGRDVRLFIFAEGGILGFFNSLALIVTLFLIGLLTHGAVVASLVIAKFKN